MKFTAKAYKYSLLLAVAVTVLILVVAIAGPGNCRVTDSSRVSRTRDMMSQLRSTLIGLMADLSHIPGQYSVSGTFDYNFVMSLPPFGRSEGTNVLFTDRLDGDASGQFHYFGLDEETFAARWKGPYSDNDPNNVHYSLNYDSWGMPFLIVSRENQVFIWSAGPDGIFDPDIFTDLNLISWWSVEGYAGDDIVTSLTRSRNPLPQPKINQMISSAYANSRRDEVMPKDGLLGKIFVTGAKPIIEYFFD